LDDPSASPLQQLAAALLEQREMIAKRSVTRMRELLPAYADLASEVLLPITLTNTSNVLKAVLDPEADPTRSDHDFRIAGETRNRQGITADALLQGWRIGVESIREEAHAVAIRLGIADEVLLEFVEATLQWGDLGMRMAAEAHREAEIGELERLAAEQASLRRVAVLVAEDEPASELFDAVTREVGDLLGADFSGMIRFDGPLVITLASWAKHGDHPPIPRFSPTQPGDPARTIGTARGPVRWNDWADVPGPIAETIRGLGVRSTVGTPIVVQGRVWGALAVHSKQATPLPPDTEARLAQFTDLVATAIANAEVRAETRVLNDEQAALRRVAELVAGEATHVEIFAAIAAEAGQLLGTDEMRMMRYEGDRDAIVVAAAGTRDDVFPIGTRWPLGGENVTSRVFRTGQPARLEYGSEISGPIGEGLLLKRARAVVGAPIVVQGQLWAAMIAVMFSDEPLPADTEARLSQFTKLMATAVANAEARAEVERLAEEQAALRRVATLAAQGAAPSAVFDAVATEMSRVLGADSVTLRRDETGETGVILARNGPAAAGPQLDAPIADRDDDVTSPTRTAPIIVDGQLWGHAVANWRGDTTPPVDTQQRMAQFIELLVIAIANADSRSKLAASRARIVVAGDEARRRFERNLHDGVQQRLVSLALRLRRIERRLPAEDTELRAALSETVQELNAATDEVREIAQGIHPAILTQGGVAPALRTLALRCPIPVSVIVNCEERLPEPVEVASYYVAAEALTNAAKHADASRASVAFERDDRAVRLRISDNGIGGVDTSAGSGLTGIRDRVEALGGSLTVLSPHGEGTTLDIALPLARRVRRH
jgi:signal transduction histidine kinase